MKKLYTLLLAITMLFIFTVAAFASTSISGTLLYRFDRDEKGVANNNSDVNFFRLNFATDASFNDDKATAYLTFQCQTYLPEIMYEIVRDNDGKLTDIISDTDAEEMFNWNIQNYGYTYSLNERWDVGFMYDTEGITLSGGQLASNWEWIHVSAFGSKNVIKLVGSPFNMVNAGIYFEPEAKEYLLKGEFKMKGLKIGAGYTNAKKIGNNNKYNVYTEILPTEKSRIYLDYISDGKYLLDTSAGLGPITAKLIASNEDRVYLGNTLIATNTADFSLDYAFSGKNTITAGLILDTYYLFDSHKIYFPAIYSRYNFDRGYAGVKYQVTNNSDAGTHINLGYRFDGTNLLEGDYNTSNGKYWIAMAVYL